MLDNFEKLKKEVFMFIDQIDAIAAGNNNRKIREDFAKLRNELDTVRYSIAVIGFMKRGKSTLLNVMLRQRNDDISPVKVEPCTAAIIRYQHTNRDEECGKALVHFKDRNKKPMDVNRTQIRDYVDNKLNPDNSKGVSYIDVLDNFPILNAAMLVDTPGKGSVHGEHDILTNEFLPFADAIILPISADLPVEAGEKEFLRDLSKQEKDHIFVVLTKVDTMTENDKAEVDAWVRKQLAEADISYDRLYYTSAKPVFKALKDGASDEEVKILVEKNGIEALENDIENHILVTSDKSRLLARRFQQIMALGYGYYDEGMQNVNRELELFKMDYGELLAEQKSNEDKKDELRKIRDKKLKDFSRTWDKHVDRFKRVLEGKEDRIVDRLSDRLEKDGLFAAVQRQPIKLVAKAVEEETSKAVSDLIDNLEDAVQKLSEDLSTDLDVYVGRTRNEDRITTITTLSAYLAIGGGGAVATHHIATTALAISSAVTSYGSAVQSAGLLSNLGGALMGGGAVKTAGAVVINTAIPGVLTISLAAGAMWIVKELIKGGLNASQKNRLPEITANTLKEISERVCASLQENRDLIVSEFTDVIEEQINYTETRLAEIADAVKRQDPMKKVALEDHRDKLLTLQRSHDDLQKQLCVLID